MTHPNGFRHIESIRIESPTPDQDMARYALLAGKPPDQAQGGWEVTTIDNVRIAVVHGDVPRFSALGLAFDGLKFISEAAAARPDLSWKLTQEGRGVLTIQSLDLCLECRSLSV
jgi:hypothetical protein